MALPGTFPLEAMDSINFSKAGNGDFPIKYVVETSLQAFIENSWEALEYLPELLATCIVEEFQIVNKTYFNRKVGDSGLFSLIGIISNSRCLDPLIK